MDLEIVDKKENALLKRTEVRFRLTHAKEKTPQRQAVREKLAAAVGGKKDGVIIVAMRSRFGAAATEGYAKVYDSPEAAKKMEPFHLLVRHGLAEAKKGAPGAAAKPAEKAPKAPEKAEAKPAAKPAEKPEAKPAAKTAEKAEAKPAEKGEAKPAAKPVEKAEAKPATKPTEKAEAKPAEKK